MKVPELHKMLSESKLKPKMDKEILDFNKTKLNSENLL